MIVKIDKNMLTAARKQFCLDIGMDYEEYLADPCRKVYLTKTKYPDGAAAAAAGARYIAGTDFGFRAMVCMGQLFVCVDERLYDWAQEDFRKAKPEWLCEYGALRKIDRKLNEIGLEIQDTHVFFLPEEDKVPEDYDPVAAPEGSDFGYLLYEEDEIEFFRKNNRFTSALCFSPTQPDRIAVAAIPREVLRADDEATAGSVSEEAKIAGSASGEAKTADVEAKTADVEAKIACEEAKTAGAEKIDEPAQELYDDRGECAEGGFDRYDQSLMAGMSGASRDGEYLWQIGINVDEKFGGRGLASDLVRRIKNELIRRGCIPFYGTAESHVLSRTVALKSGFVPAWTEIYACRRS